MIMALISHIESQLTSNGSTSNQKKKKEKKKKDGEDKNESDADKSNGSLEKEKKTGNYPAWKLEAPKEGDAKTQMRGDKKFHWCRKCRQGKGLWARHAEEDHSDNFKPKFDNTSRPSSRQSSESSANSGSNDTPSIQVRKDLLSNAKAYIASRQDFQGGGVQD